MKYRNGRWNLLIASVLIIIISILQWHRWGIKILQELDDGCFFFLGGPSLFYPTALFPSLVALGFLISFFCSLGVVEISDSNNVLYIREKKGWITQEVTLSYESIISSSFSNTIMRWSALGAVVLILSSYYLFIDGISLLTYHAVYGYGIDTGIYYVLQASGNLVAVIFVLFLTPGEIRIRSAEIDRIIIFIPIIWRKSKKNRFRSYLLQTLHIPIEERIHNNELNVLNLIYGFLLISSSILSRVFLVFSNEILRLIYLFIGILCIVRGVKILSINSQKGIFMSESSQNEKKNTILYIFYVSWIIIIAITLFTIINNAITIPLGTSIPLITLMNSLFGLLMLFPGFWLGIRYITQRRIKKLEKLPK